MDLTAVAAGAATVPGTQQTLYSCIPRRTGTSRDADRLKR